MLVILFRKIGYHQRLVGVEIVCTFARTNCHVAAPVACRALEHIVIVHAVTLVFVWDGGEKADYFTATLVFGAAGNGGRPVFVMLFDGGFEVVTAYSAKDFLSSVKSFVVPMFNAENCWFHKIIQFLPCASRFK